MVIMEFRVSKGELFRKLSESEDARRDSESDSVPDSESDSGPESESDNQTARSHASLFGISCNSDDSCRLPDYHCDYDSHGCRN